MILNRLKKEWLIYLILATFLIWYLSNLKGALWSDEVYYAESGYYYITGEHLYWNPTHPPLAKYFMGISQHLLGRTSAAARLPSVILAILVLFLTYKIGKDFFGQWVGFFATILLGTTLLFSKFAVQAMLEMALTFFVLLLFYFVLKYNQVQYIKKKKLALIIGSISACVFASKYVGVMLVFVPFVYLLWNDIKKKRLSESHTLRYIVGFVVTFLLVYSPYLTPNFDKISRYELPDIEHYVHPKIWEIYAYLGERLPHLPTVFYLFTVTVGYYIPYFHLGHQIIVANVIYKHPPIWTYLYYIYDYLGLVYLLGLVLFVALVSYSFLKKEKNHRKLLLCLSYWIVPLIVLSILPLKNYFYLIPIIPLLAISSIFSLKLVTGLVMRKKKEILVVLILGLIILPNVIHAIKNPQIGIDSGFDVAANKIIDYVTQHSQQNITVLSFYYHNLEYYLGDNTPKNINLLKIDLYRDPPFDKCFMLAEGKIGIVIDLRYQPRFSNTETYRCIRQTARRVEDIKDTLQIFYIK